MKHLWNSTRTTNYDAENIEMNTFERQTDNEASEI